MFHTPTETKWAICLKNVLSKSISEISWTLIHRPYIFYPYVVPFSYSKLSISSSFYLGFIFKQYNSCWCAGLFQIKNAVCIFIWNKRGQVLFYTLCLLSFQSPSLVYFIFLFINDLIFHLLEFFVLCAWKATPGINCDCFILSLTWCRMRSSTTSFQHYTLK